MKILYDNTIFKLQKYGGILRYFSEIIKRIRQYDDTEVYISRCLTGKLAKLNNIWLDYRFSLNKFDIYHPTYYSYNVKKRKNVKTVVTVYDMIHELYLSNMYNFKNDILVKKKSILNADHIICISYNTKKDLQRIYNINDKLISVIYAGSPIVRNKIERDKYIVSDRPYLLYVGKRGSYKNFVILLKAFHLLNMERDFNLVCFGGEKFSNEEVLEFKRLKLENSIKYIYGPEELLQFCYENARVFIYPSLYEGFGLPIVEAMAFGCPVIASDTSSISEITDNAVMLFSPQNVNELCNCIKNIINDNKIRSDYIEKGRRRSEDFSWNKAALETFDVYKNLLN